MTVYKEFLESKRLRNLSSDITIDNSSIHPALFPFQRDIVRWAVHKGRAAVFADTGMGKTFIQLEWARLLGKRTLIIAPLSVARQTVREAEKIEIGVHYVRSQGEVGADGIWITNYDMIDRFDMSQFGAVVLDECFVADTPVDTEKGTKFISEIEPGDKVFTATGLQPVIAVKQQHCDSLVLTMIQGHDILSSANHPYLTMRGWVPANRLREGDRLVYTTEAMRLVRDGIDGEAGQVQESLLRKVLLSEMADAPTRDYSAGAYEGSSCSDWAKDSSLVSIRQSKCNSKYRTHSTPKPNQRSCSKNQTLQEITGDTSPSDDTGGKWAWSNSSSEDASGQVRDGVALRVSDQSGAQDARLSHSIQGRYSTYTKANSNRSGWLQPRCDGTQGTGCKEGCEIAGVRVDRVALYQSDDPLFARYRDETGRVILYDLQVDGHPSFSVHGLLVHNSSILKAIDSKTRKQLTEQCSVIPYRLCCTATPAPNDYTEIGNHAQFLGICAMSEMLAMFFINANKQHTFDWAGKIYERKGSNKAGTEWRLKHHAEQPFFQWLSSWAMTITKPSDLGYDDDGFILPHLGIYPMFVETNHTPDDQLVFTHLKGIADRSNIRRATIAKRLEVLENLVASSSDQWIIWCGLQDEANAIKSALPDVVEVKGDDSPDSKAEAFERFQDNEYQILLTKSKIGGFGLNMQQSHQAIFFGLNDSWEMWYQCIRRQWRFGQTQPVSIHVIMSDIEEEIWENVQRKDAAAARLRHKMIELIRTYEEEELMGTEHTNGTYTEETVTGNGWTAMRGDSSKRLGELADNSIDLSVYSPPFADLYTYSASDRDLGNSKDWAQFFEHYAFIIREVLRVTKPGRLTCVHTAEIPAMQQKDGYIGVKDFPGEVIRAYEKEGWQYVGRALVQKNPQAQAIRIHASSLLFVQMRADSTKSRPALVDHVLLFKKPGDNLIPVTPVENGEMTNDKWINWAHGIWTDIRETETLQYGGARAADDDKHICPLQLGTIERCVKLYSNPGEIILTPFGGIGSEGYVAVKFGRKAIAIELKDSYFQTMVNNLRNAEMVGDDAPLLKLIVSTAAADDDVMPHQHLGGGSR